MTNEEMTVLAEKITEKTISVLKERRNKGKSHHSDAEAIRASVAHMIEKMQKETA